MENKRSLLKTEFLASPKYKNHTFESFEVPVTDPCVNCSFMGHIQFKCVKICRCPYR
jgi:hypothetical protein